MLYKGIFSRGEHSTNLVPAYFIGFSYDVKELEAQQLYTHVEGFNAGKSVYKNEAIEAAFSRLTLAELGQEFHYSQARLLGAYDHFYVDSVFGEGISTHYVALAHQFSVQQLAHLPVVQHDSYGWFSVEQLLADEQVHPHTKAYFLKGR